MAANNIRLDTDLGVIVRKSFPKDIDGIFAILSEQGAFELLEPNDIDRLKAATRLVDLGDGEDLYAQGALQASVYVLLEGTVLLWRRCPDGVERPVNALRQPVWMTSQATTLSQPRLTRLSASGPARLAVADGPEFEALLDDTPRMWRWIAAMASRDVAVITNLVTALLIDSTDASVAARLAGMARESDGDGFVVEISQSQLAQLCGISRNTVHRTLTRFEERGLVRRGYRRLEILDRPGLERVVTAGTG